VEAIEPAKARRALALLGAVLLGQAVLMVLVAGLTQLLFLFSSSLDLWFNVQSALWIVAGALEAWALYELAGSVKPAGLVVLALGATVLLTLSSVFWLIVEVMNAHVGAPGALRLALVALALVEVLGLCVAIGRLGRTTAFAYGIGAVAVIRAMSSAALVLRDAGAGPTPVWTNAVRSLLAALCMGGAGALALHARGVVSRTASVTGEALPAPILEASGMRQVVAGVVLLVVGIGGTAASYASASSGGGGGRYFIATGAIAAGLVQLVRGISRLKS